MKQSEVQTKVMAGEIVFVGHFLAEAAREQQQVAALIQQSLQVGLRSQARPGARG